MQLLPLIAFVVASALLASDCLDRWERSRRRPPSDPYFERSIWF